jgi:hypothetical protein
MSSPLEEPHFIKMKRFIIKISIESPEIYKKITDILAKGNNPESIQQIKGVLEGTKYESKYNDLVENVDPDIKLSEKEIEDIIKNDARGNGENKFFYDKNNRTHVELIKHKPTKSAQLGPKKKIEQTSRIAKKQRNKKIEKEEKEEKEEDLFGSELDFELKGGSRKKSRKNTKSKKSRKSRKQRK